MPSIDNRDLKDLFAGVQTTVEEVEALEAVRRLDHLDPVQYLDFLKQFAPRHPPSREIPPRHEPFVL